MRQHPTLPSDDKIAAVDRGELWPRAFCAFAGCAWFEMHGTERQLQEHLHAAHAADLAPIAAHMLRGDADDAYLSIYNEAIATKCRAQAPLAGSSLDRKALKSFAEACQGNRVEALVCFVCACTYAYVQEMSEEGKGDIHWVQPVQTNLDADDEFQFLQRSADDAGELLSLRTFLGRYGKISDAGPSLQDHENFDDWCLNWPSNAFPAGRKILCCPEDRDVFKTHFEKRARI